MYKHLYNGIYRLLGMDDLCMILSTNAHAVGVMHRWLQGLLGSMLTDSTLDLRSPTASGPVPPKVSAAAAAHHVRRILPSCSLQTNFLPPASALSAL